METKIKLLPKIRMQFTYNGVNAVIVECDYWFCVYAECPEYKDSEKLHTALATVNRRTEQLRLELYRDLNISKEQS